MGICNGRVVIVTGSGRGIGREHALAYAREGAKVVVNDLGGDMHGEGGDPSAAMQVVEEIKAMGGEAVADGENVADFAGAGRMIQRAIDTFGHLDTLVNNAGILRDRTIVNMTEEEWDDVIAVHLKGHFVPTRHAAAYWRGQAKAGFAVTASVINTSSTSGLLGNPFQTNYGAAKAGIGAFTIIAAHELVRYGVRVNAIVPAARTRLTSATEGLHDMIQPPANGAFDIWDPANVSPLVGWLATEGCRATGKVFYAQGGTIQLMSTWSMGDGVERRGRWTITELEEELGKLVGSSD
jgi:NAD(P)-dependent dehydrogenase (short-subunit alcohol dehydrogenase family)